MNLRVGEIVHFGGNVHSYRKMETSWELIKKVAKWEVGSPWFPHLATRKNLRHGLAQPLHIPEGNGLAQGHAVSATRGTEPSVLCPVQHALCRNRQVLSQGRSSGEQEVAICKQSLKGLNSSVVTVSHHARWASSRHAGDTMIQTSVP